MANEAHMALVRRGAQALNEERARQPDLVLDLVNAQLGAINLEGAILGPADCSTADFRGVNLRGANCVNVNFTETQLVASKLEKADASGANLTAANLTDAKLTAVKMRGAVLNATILTGANTEGVDFDRAIITRMVFDGATLERAQLTNLTLDGFSFNGANLAGANFTGSSLRATTLSNTNLVGASFFNVDLFKCNFVNAKMTNASLRSANAMDASFWQADLTGSILVDASFERTSFVDAKLDGSDICGANFYEATLNGVTMRNVEGAFYALNLGTTRIAPENDVRYFDLVQRDWREYLVDWEKIRVFGRLPIFGVSYTALAIIPLFLYMRGIYNENIDAMRAWVTQTLSEPKLSAVLKHLNPVPIPESFWVLFGATLVLAVAATIYAVACPPKIKTFSQEQWRYEHGHSLVHYWPEAWKSRWVRLFCATAYVLGGLGATYIISTKLWWVAVTLYRG